MTCFKTATHAFAFPTYGNGLKEVAPYMGFAWRNTEVNAMESMALFFEYLKDPATQRQKLHQVLEYNEDDCRATRVVKDWLASHANGRQA